MILVESGVRSKFSKSLLSLGLECQLQQGFSLPETCEFDDYATESCRSNMIMLRQTQVTKPLNWHLFYIAYFTKGEKKVKIIHNVFAVIKGLEEPDRYVILGNHRDAWTYGAVDPNSGTAALLDIARRYALLMQKGLEATKNYNPW
ncbi:hypothetical protein OIU77_030920 [Salix suchowensis]|uniref:Peptidase M28 domain-containing protein n=1 Tax=Salix suchowensis TaxID=1278906 RepID=A0ABQ9BFS8_9ROSI|nr:hypothetical protein OIU77_030920 [Salix suchowensis]